MNDILNTNLYYIFIILLCIFSGVTFLWVCAIVLGLILWSIILIIITLVILSYYSIENILLKLYIYFDLHYFKEIELYESHYSQDLISFSINHGKVYSYMCLHQRLPIYRLYMKYILMDNYHGLKHNTLFISNFLLYLKIEDVMDIYLRYNNSIFIKHILKNYNINLFFNLLCPDIKNIIYNYYIKSIT